MTIGQLDRRDAGCLIHDRRTQRWAACTKSGVFIEYVDSNDLADMIEDYARRVRTNSDTISQWPPVHFYQAKEGEVEIIFRRTHVPKFDTNPVVEHPLS